MTNEQCAKRFADMGYPVFPCGRNDKKPIIPNGCKGGTTNDLLVEAYWYQEPEANIGITCTECFVIDIDVKNGDGNKDWNEIRSLIQDIPDNPPETRTPTGGRHLFFKKPSRTIPASCGIVVNGKKTNIDIRTGYTYVMAPGSEIDGKKYEEIRPLVPPNELPELPDAFFDLLKEKPTASDHALPPVPTFGEFDLTEDAVTQCRRYLAKVPGIIEATEKGNCHKRLLQVANIIFQGFLLNNTEGLPVLEEFNARCDPPWSQKELEHKVQESILKPIPGKEAGWLLRKKKQPVDLSGFLNWADEKLNGPKNDISPVNASIANDYAPDPVPEPAPEHSEGIDPFGPVIIQGIEITPEEIGWLWKGYIPKESLTLISGKGSAGKTSFVIDLCARVTSGRHWPNGAPSEEGCVLYLYSEEIPKNSIIPKFIAAGGNLNNIFLMQFVKKPDGEKRFSLDEMNYLDNAIKKIESKTGKRVLLTVFDPVTGFMGGADTNKNSVVRDILVNIPNFLESHKDLAVLGICHTKKGANIFESAADTTSGASEFVNIARCVLQVYHDSDRGTRLALPSKWNIGKMPLGIEYDIVPGTVPGFTESVGKIEYLSTEYEETADEYIDRKRSEKLSAGKKKPKKTCREWLASLIADRGKLLIGDTRTGNPPDGSVMSFGFSEGYSRTTINRAISVLHLDKVKIDGQNWVQFEDYAPVMSDTDGLFDSFSSGDFDLDTMYGNDKFGKEPDWE